MMENVILAANALDGLPVGAQIAAAYIDENDDTATVIMFDHREHDGRVEWWDMTRRQVWWSSADIARAFDDMVVTANPDQTRTGDALADAIERGDVLTEAERLHVVLAQRSAQLARMRVRLQMYGSIVSEEDHE